MYRLIRVAALGAAYVTITSAATSPPTSAATSEGSSTSAVCGVSPPPNAFRPLGQLSVRSAQNIGSPFPFSVGAECMDRNYTEIANWLPYLSPLGAKEARIQGGWGRCEPTRGTYDFAWLDTIVNDMTAVGVTPWIQLSYGNPVYGPDGGSIEVNSPLPVHSAFTAFLAWTTALVTRYSGAVTTYEIWNEPNIQHINASSYAAFAAAVAATVRAVQPDSILRFGVLAGVDLLYATDTLAALGKANALGLVDVLTFHPYSYNSDSTYEDVKQLAALVAAASPRLSIAQGENGAPSERSTYGALGNYSWDQCSQAKWFSRRLVRDRSLNLPTSAFTIADICYSGTINTKGLVQANCPNMTVVGPKLSYSAVQRVVSTLDATLVAVGPPNVTVTAVPSDGSALSPTASLLLFNASFLAADGSGRVLVTLWAAGETPTNASETVTTLMNVTVTVGGGGGGGGGWEAPRGPWSFADLMTGTVYSVGVEGGSGVTTAPFVPVSDFAVLLGDASLLPVVAAGGV
jgi:hypothetical protein